MAHCEAVCAAWAIPLTVERVHLQDEGLGIEAQARKARYAAFAAELQPDEALVTAQHLDDQCETLLLALKRGSGPAGLSAMPERLISPDRTSFAHCLARREPRWKRGHGNTG